jgi:hypothetical protein
VSFWTWLTSLKMIFAEGVAQVVEHLLSKHKTWSSNSSPNRKKKGVSLPFCDFRKGPFGLPVLLCGRKYSSNLIFLSKWKALAFCLLSLHPNPSWGVIYVSWLIWKELHEGPMSTLMPQHTEAVKGRAKCTASEWADLGSSQFHLSVATDIIQPAHLRFHI